MTLKYRPFWESYEPVPGSEKPLRRIGHASITHGDHIIMFLTLCPSTFLLPQPSVPPMADITSTKLGCLTIRHESGLSYNVPATFYLIVKVTLLPSSMMSFMSLVGVASTELVWMI
ncbi:hypothetical protein BGY98DRAFT_304815 [Russula aff. rugulosa BPL654]|nr:hypothetical protein BGY98DRAFT_304815 [Russula aff. rugulosa BPL654]